VSEDEKEAKKESVCDLIIKQAVGLCKEYVFSPYNYTNFC